MAPILETSAGRCAIITDLKNVCLTEPSTLILKSTLLGIRNPSCIAKRHQTRERRSTQCFHCLTPTESTKQQVKQSDVGALPTTDHQSCVDPQLAAALSSWATGENQSPKSRHALAIKHQNVGIQSPVPALPTVHSTKLKNRKGISAVLGAKRELERFLNTELTQCLAPDDIFRIVDVYKENLTTVNAVTAFYRLARLSKGLRPEQKAALRNSEGLHEVARLVQDKVPWCGWRSLANLAWAESHLQVGGACLYEAVEEAALQQPTKRAPKEEELVALVSSFSRSGAPAPRLFALVAGLIQPNVAKYNSWQIAQLAWTYAKARHLNAEFLDALKGKAVRCLDTFTCQSLSLLLWSWTELGLEDEAFFDRIAAAVKVRIQEYPPVDISITARSFAKAGKDYSSVMAALVERSKAVVKDFAPDNLSGLICSLGMAKYYDGDLLHMLLSSHTHRVAALAPQEASNVLWGLAMLRYFDPAFMDAVANSMCEQLRSFDDVQIGNVLFAFATFGYSGPPDFLPTVAKEVLQRLRQKAEFKRASLVHIAWGFMVLKAYDAELFARLRVALCRAAFFEHEYAMLHQVEVALTLEAPAIVPRFVLNDVNEYFEDLWLTGRTKHLAKLYWAKHKGANLMTSALQRSVQSALERLGIPSVEEYTDADYMIDIAIPEHQIAIEVDGPHHYAANVPKRSLGPTLLKHRLLRKLGWRLITVPHYEWQSLDSNEARAAYMQQRLEQHVRAAQEDAASEQPTPASSPQPSEGCPPASSEDTSQRTSKEAQSEILARSEKLKMLAVSRGKGGKISMLKNAAMRRAILTKGAAAEGDAKTNEDEGT